MKRQNDRSIAGCAFSEDGHPAPGAELFRCRLEDLMHRVASTTFDEQGSCEVA